MSEGCLRSSVSCSRCSSCSGIADRSARKAKVLGDNVDTATRFGTDMSSLSTDLRGGLDKLNSVQGRFGEEMQKGLEAYAKHAQKVRPPLLCSTDQADRVALQARHHQP